MKTVAGICCSVIVSTSLLVGCGGEGPELIDVAGTVTLDGKPLPDASLEFKPAGGGADSPAYGKTDANGRYRLEYRDGITGARPGKYTVQISTYQAAFPDAGLEYKPEKVPAQYNAQTTLTTEVRAGGGPYNFDLTSEGEIVEPEGGEEGEI